MLATGGVFRMMHPSRQAKHDSISYLNMTAYTPGMLIFMFMLPWGI